MRQRDYCVSCKVFGYKKQNAGKYVPGNKDSHLVALFACRQSEHRSDFGSLLPKITNYANVPTTERHGREVRGQAQNAHLHAGGIQDSSEGISSVL